MTDPEVVRRVKNVLNYINLMQIDCIIPHDRKTTQTIANNLIHFVESGGQLPTEHDDVIRLVLRMRTYGLENRLERDDSPTYITVKSPRLEIS